MVDTETTGLVTDEWARPVEIGAVVMDRTGRELATFSALLCPDVIDDRASVAFGISGITIPEVRAALPAVDVVNAFEAWMREQQDPAAGPPLSAWAWGAEFDEEMLARVGCIVALDCGMGWACDALIRGERPRMRLVDAALDLGVAVPAGLHRALTDARLAARVILALGTVWASEAPDPEVLAYVREGRKAWRVAGECPYPKDSLAARAWLRGAAQGATYESQGDRAGRWRATVEAIGTFMQVEVIEWTGSTSARVRGGPVLGEGSWIECGPAWWQAFDEHGAVFGVAGPFQSYTPELSPALILASLLQSPAFPSAKQGKLP